jgi:hypothetical protein
MNPSHDMGQVSGMPGVIGFVGCRGAKVRRVMRLIAGDAVRHTPCRSRCNLLIAFLGSTRFQKHVALVMAHIRVAY